MKKFNKIVFWGYPLYSHTHSYVWYGYYKAAKLLYPEAEVVWHKDEPNNAIFDEYTLIFAESYQMRFLPKSFKATYVIHTLRPDNLKDFTYPENVYDLAYNCHYQDHDVNYNFTLDRYKLKNATACPASFYDKTLRRIYTYWATDLLPGEFNYDLPVMKTISSTWIGTIYDDKYSNRPQLDQWAVKCSENNIPWDVLDPWTTGHVNMSDNRYIIQRSRLSPDLRGQQNIDCGYISCRLFKNISYGVLGMTNSLTSHAAMGGLTVFCPSVNRLFDLGLREVNNFDRIREQMKFVECNHTYINRLNAILEFVS